MHYTLSKHALDVIGEREIQEVWIEVVLSRPERTEPDRADPTLEHRLGRVSELEITAQSDCHTVALPPILLRIS